MHKCYNAQSQMRRVQRNLNDSLASQLIRLQYCLPTRSSTVYLAARTLPVALLSMIQGTSPIATRVAPGSENIVIISMDFSLEAFSCYPTHGSFAALPVQATALTNYVNQRFLSY